MPTRKETCAAQGCGVQFRASRKGCGGRQYIVQSHMDHAHTLLKPDADVGVWVCMRHRDALKQCVEQATALQPMVRCKFVRFQLGVWLFTHVCCCCNSKVIDDRDGKQEEEDASAAVTLTQLQQRNNSTPSPSVSPLTLPATKSPPVSPATHASSVRTVRSLKRKLSSNSLSPQNARADAGIRALLSGARDENAQLQAATTINIIENDRLRDSLKQKQRQLTQSKQHRKHVAADKKDAQSQVSDLQAELKERTAEAEEMASDYEEMEMELLYEQSRADTNANSPQPSPPPQGLLQPMTLFHDGRYDDALRAVIYAFIRGGVGKDRIAPLVGVTMQLLANKRITDLPSPATIARMSTELNTLTQIQLYERLTTDSTATTVLAHDGTTKSGKKLGAGVVHIDRSRTATTNESKRESVALFVREQADGTAESGMRALTDSLSDINAVGKLVFPERNAATANFHGVLSDHNVTEHKTNAMVLSASAVSDSIEMLCWNHKYVRSL